MFYNLNASNISEIVKAGFCHHAIAGGILDIKKLLNFLKDQDVTEETLLAYRTVCLITLKDEHYLDIKGEQKHFTTLTDNIEYMLIYILSEGDYNIPSTVNGDKTLINERSEELAKIYKAQNRYTRIRVLCDLEYSEVYKHFHLINKIFKNNENSIKKYKENDLTYYFRTYWFEAIKSSMTTEHYRILIKECNYVKNNYKWLWKNFVYDELKPIVSDTFLDKKLPEHITKKDVEELVLLFPGCLPIEIHCLSSEAFNIYKLDNKLLQAYILGFPIEYFIPSYKRIKMALYDLTELGIEKYIEKMKSYRKNHSGEIYDTFVNYNNTYDVYHIEFEEYNPFDVVEYIEEGQIYRFSRSEFKLLLKTRKNIWNNQEIPEIILYEIHKRLSIAKKNKFPPCQTWINLLTLRNQIE